MTDHFYWSERVSDPQAPEITFVAWIARPGTRKEFVRFYVEHADDGWKVFYSPEERTRSKLLQSGFETADKARTWAEVIFKLGAADALWGRAGSPSIYDD